MGALLALFNSNELADVKVDWSTLNEATPSDADLYRETDQLIQRLRDMNTEIDNYKDGKEEISAAMRATLAEAGPPTRAAFDLVATNAALCRGWMDTAGIIATHLKDRILPQLSKLNPDIQESNQTDEKKDDNNIQNNNNNNNSNNDENNILTELTIISHQGLCKQLCEILEFVYEFDQKKVLNSQIQMDFAFYKRTLSKTQEDYMKGCNVTVNGEQAGFISMFLAYPNPIVREIYNQLSNNNNLNVLGYFINSINDLLKGNKFENDPNNAKMCIIALIISFIVYDNANGQTGGFQRQSVANSSKVCKMLCSQYIDIYGVKDDVVGLHNLFRYHTNKFEDRASNSVKRQWESFNQKTEEWAKVDES